MNKATSNSNTHMKFSYSFMCPINILSIAIDWHHEVLAENHDLNSNSNWERLQTKFKYEEQDPTYVTYLRMHSYLENACHISNVQCSRRKLNYISSRCLYPCHKIAEIFHRRSILIVVRRNYDFALFRFLSTYGIIELTSNLAKQYQR